ncbi:MAG: lipoyl(octanoyl) transferase LipB [Hyphomicrobiaceae bacterium]|nr:lipoyl(octanoyl) transferase LipB [Hyphomicrobiaceae bacterium]
MPGSGASAVEWRSARTPVGYADAVSDMEQRVAAIRSKTADECVWLLEHPPLYTAGTSAAPSDLLTPDRFPVIATGRGGQYTYHGPGQRVAYVMLDLAGRGKDIRAYVCELEDWIIASLARFGISGERREGRVGVWVSRPDKGPDREDKIAAVGVRVRRWVTFHGISLNVNPDLEHYSGIVPCGINEHGVTSLADLGVCVDMREVDAVLRTEFEARFGSVRLDDAISNA